MWIQCEDGTLVNTDHVARFYSNGVHVVAEHPRGHTTLLCISESEDAARRSLASLYTAIASGHSVVRAVPETSNAIPTDEPGREPAAQGRVERERSQSERSPVNGQGHVVPGDDQGRVERGGGSDGIGHTFGPSPLLGFDDALRQSTARVLESLGIPPRILVDLPNALSPPELTPLDRALATVHITARGDRITIGSSTCLELLRAYRRIGGANSTEVLNAIRLVLESRNIPLDYPTTTSYVWTTNDGRRLLLAEMSDQHLRNTIAHLERTGRNRTVLANMQTELERRYPTPPMDLSNLRSTLESEIGSLPSARIDPEGGFTL